MIPGPSRRRWAVGTAAGLPLAFVALLAVQAGMATRGQYLPAHFGDRVDATLEPTDGAAGGATLRMVMLGDSTVAGIGSPTTDGTLPVQTAQRVADANGRPVSVTGLGVSGARTADIAREQIPLVGDDVDVLVIVIGSNDTTHATPWWRLDDETREMIDAARRAAPGAAIVLGGVPLFGSADALAQPLRWVVDQYAKPLRRVQQRVAAEQDITFVNIAVEASPRFRGVAEAMSTDGFHPAPVGYGFWADALTVGVVDALG
jgi:lysophospholipase L1-like esterase